jgi:hypothetical protein
MQFPTITTRDLNKRQLSLPRDLEGEVNLLLLGYAEWQRQQFETWLPVAARLEKSYPQFYYYELPVIGPVSILSRLLLDQAMRAGIPGRDMRARVLTLYVDKELLNQQLGIENEHQITLLLVQQDGAILWRETGVYSHEKASALEEVLVAPALLEKPRV